MSNGSATTDTPTPAVGAGLAPPAPAKTKVEKAQSYLALISTCIGICGAVGTGFVWLATSFFLGDVQIAPSKPVDAVCVKVIDKRGQAATYYAKDVQLMPGKYHLEISVPDIQTVQHADVDVKLWKISTIPYTVPEKTAANAATEETSEQSAQADEPHKRWWQFWKKAE